VHEEDEAINVKEVYSLTSVTNCSTTLFAQYVVLDLHFSLVSWQLEIDNLVMSD
jgi:hypothetical protein